VIFLLLAMFPSAVLGQVPESIFAQNARVADWKGTVEVTLPGQSASQPLRGEELPTGSIIETRSGRILVNLNDGSQILIYARTKVVLKEPSLLDPNYLHMLMGRIRAQISKRTGGSPSFQLGTPSAVVTVRGTKFFVEVNPAQVTEVDVIDGEVQVSGVHQPAKSVLLEPGFSTRVSRQGDPEGPIPTDEIRPDLDRGGEDTNDSERNDEGDKGEWENHGNIRDDPGSNSGFGETSEPSATDPSGPNGPDR
jgi:hypothetical protein